MKKILALILAMMMVMAMCAVAFADEPTTPEPDGSITIKNATKGHTYTAYKVFDATYDGDAVSYTTPAENADLLDDTLFGWSEPDAAGNISVWALEDASESDIIDWVKDNYAEFGGSAISGDFDETDSTVTFSGLEYGYYYITSSLGSSVTIDSAAPSAEVYDKNFVEPTDPVKTIIAIDGTEQDEVTEANAHVGSVVTFQVTAYTVNWTGAKTSEGSIETVTEDEVEITTEWEFTDKPHNMTIDQDSIVVTVNGVEISNFEVTGTDSMTLTIPMVDENGNSIYEAPEDGLIPIVVIYDATIEAAAASDAAYNEIPGPNPPPPVVIYTYGFQVAKTDDEGEPLQGAQFELWSDGAALTFIDNGDGTYTFSETAPEGGELVTTLDMTTNTTISLLGLDESWTYTLKEITVPSGYNKIEDVDVDGSDLTKIGEITVTPNEDGSQTITVVEIDTSIESEALYKEIVENHKGQELPSTGGMGTTILYIVGSLLVLGAGVVLVTKRRMN